VIAARQPGRRWLRRTGATRLVRLGRDTPTTNRRYDRAARWLDRAPRRSIGVAAVVAALAGAAIAGPVAGLIAAAYAGAAVIFAVRYRRERAGRAAQALALDAFVALVAELRAGADTGAAMTPVVPVLRSAGATGTRLAAQAMAARRVSEVTGARLSGLLDRLEEDVRAVSRARGAASAQAAGAQATAGLLAAMPAGGLALGYGIGTDPLHVLLHTRPGAVCALLAVAFQFAGLGWSSRLTRATREAA
jgi:tight adherence protein B